MSVKCNINTFIYCKYNMNTRQTLTNTRYHDYDQCMSTSISVVHQVPSSDLFIKHPSLRLILSQAHDVRASKHAQMNRMRKKQMMKRYEKNEREIMQRESESVWGQIKKISK